MQTSQRKAIALHCTTRAPTPNLNECTGVQNPHCYQEVIKTLLLERSLWIMPLEWRNESARMMS